MLRVDGMPTTNLMEDNTAALKWCYNPINHGKQKHIPVAYHFIREQVVQFNNINVVPIPTETQLADLYTKCLPSPRFKFLVDTIRGLHPTPVARPTNAMVDTVKGALGETLLSLKERMLQLDPATQAQPFFNEHFEEPDPVLLQQRAGLHHRHPAAPAI